MNYLYAIFIFLISCTLATDHTQGTSEQTVIQLPKDKNHTPILDSLKVAQSLAIIEAELTEIGSGNKYIYSKIRVLRVLQNNTSYAFPDTLQLAHYSTAQGIPKQQKCIIYLSAWPYGSKKLNAKNEWMLLEGDGEYACECKDTVGSQK